MFLSSTELAFLFGPTPIENFMDGIHPPIFHLSGSITVGDTHYPHHSVMFAEKFGFICAPEDELL